VRRRGGRLAVAFRSPVLESAPVTLANRRTIRLEISAARGHGRPRASVEDHEYEAVIEGANTGRHMLRVNHVWLLSPSLGGILVMPAYEGAVVVTARQPERPAGASAEGQFCDRAAN
jgi:hypothetical protein